MASVVIRLGVFGLSSVKTRTRLFSDKPGQDFSTSLEHKSVRSRITPNQKTQPSFLPCVHRYWRHGHVSLSMIPHLKPSILVKLRGGHTVRLPAEQAAAERSTMLWRMPVYPLTPWLNTHTWHTTASRTWHKICRPSKNATPLPTHSKKRSLIELAFMSYVFQCVNGLRTTHSG
jgi:hypothetical protein